MAESMEGFHPLSPDQIVELGKKAANQVNRLAGFDLIDPAQQGRIALELSLAVHEMTHPELQEIQRAVPEEADD